MIKVKKILAKLVIISLVFTCFSVDLISAAGNETNDRNFEYKFELLRKMGIADETDLSKEVTRAAFATAVAKLMKYEESGNVDEPSNYYMDVDNADEYAAAVKAVTQFDLMKGYGDKTFRPDIAVSGDEVLVTLLKCVGYGNLSNYSFINDVRNTILAKRSGLLKGISIAQEENISYEQLILLLYNAATIPMFKIRSVTAEGSAEYEKREGINILSELHHTYAGKGKANGNSISALAENACAKDEIRIDDCLYKTDSPEYHRYLGYNVEFYYVDNNVDLPQIVCLRPDSSVKEITINASDVMEYNAGYLQYSDSRKAINLKLSNVCELIFNGVAQKEFSKKAFFQDSGTVKLVSNDGSGTYDLIIIETYSNYVVNSITRNGTEFTITGKYGLKKLIVDTGLSDKQVEFVGPDGSQYAFNQIDKISANTILSIYSDQYDVVNGRKFPSDDAKHIRLVVCDQTLNGEFESSNASDNEMKISGEKYKTAINNFLYERDNELSLGAQGVFYLDIGGEVAAWRKSETGMEYGYLIQAVAYGNELSSKAEMKVLTKENKVEAYTISNIVHVNDKRIKNNGSAVVEALNNSAKLLDANASQNSQVIKYMLNSNGEVCKLETVLQSLDQPQYLSGSHLRRECNKTYLQKRFENYHCLYTGDTPVYNPPLFYFVVPEVYSSEDDDYKSGTVSDISWKNEESKLVEVYNCSTANQPDICVIYGEADNVIPLTVLLVDGIVTTLNDEGETVSAIYGCDGQNESVQYEGRDLNTFDGVKHGDVVALYGTNNKIRRWDSPLLASAFENISTQINTPSVIDPTCVYMAWSLWEVWAIEGNSSVLQSGPIIDEETGERSTKRTLYWQSDTFSSGGICLYDETVGRKSPIVGLGAASDVKAVLSEGSQNASYLLVGEAGATPYRIYILNLEC